MFHQCGYAVDQFGLVNHCPLMSSLQELSHQGE